MRMYTKYKQPLKHIRSILNWNKLFIYIHICKLKNLSQPWLTSDHINLKLGFNPERIKQKEDGN